MIHPDDQYVYPVYGPDNETDHVIDGSPCWCDPRMFVLCTECGHAGPGGSDPSCWKCGGEGLVEVDRRIDPGVPIIISHNEA